MKEERLLTMNYNKLEAVVGMLLIVVVGLIFMLTVTAFMLDTGQPAKMFPLVVPELWKAAYGQFPGSPALGTNDDSDTSSTNQPSPPTATTNDTEQQDFPAGFPEEWKQSDDPLGKVRTLSDTYPRIREMPQNTVFWYTVHQLGNMSAQEGDQALGTFVEIYVRCHEELDNDTFVIGMEQCRAVYDQAKSLYCSIQSYDASKCDAISQLVQYYEDKVFEYFMIRS